MRQLILEGGRGDERLVFPEDRVDFHPASEFASQSIDDAACYQPLFRDVTRGRQEYPECVQYRRTLLNERIADNGASGPEGPLAQRVVTPNLDRRAGPATPGDGQAGQPCQQQCK
ncbi:MAG: hypothetical protein AMXMBFR37_15680 [Steroidobacteraceae bacterium]